MSVNVVLRVKTREQVIQLYSDYINNKHTQGLCRSKRRARFIRQPVAGRIPSTYVLSDIKTQSSKVVILGQNNSIMLPTHLLSLGTIYDRTLFTIYSLG